MGLELTILLGLGLVSSILAYYGLSFLENEEFFTKLVGQIFFMVSMIFLLLLVNTLFLVIQNDVSIAYLKDTVGIFAMEVFYYFMVIGVVIYIFWMFIGIAKMVVDGIKHSTGSGGRKKSKEGDVE